MGRKLVKSLEESATRFTTADKDDPIAEVIASEIERLAAMTAETELHVELCRQALKLLERYKYRFTPDWKSGAGFLSKFWPG